MACAAALEVQRIIREENLVENVRNTGAYLENLLHAHLDSHPHVGSIRGRGLFWGVSKLQGKLVETPLSGFQDRVRCRQSDQGTVPAVSQHCKLRAS